MKSPLVVDIRSYGNLNFWGGSSVAEHPITIRKVVGSYPTPLACPQWVTSPVLWGWQPQHGATAIRDRQARSWYQDPKTWVGMRAPTPNTLVPSAPRCVGLADLSVMAPRRGRTHRSSYSYSYKILFGL